jgi:hypothetical protein
VTQDWRVTVTFSDLTDARKAAQAIRTHHVEGDLRRRLGGNAAVSADGPAVFLYADTKDGAREADRVVREVLSQHCIIPEGLALDRWEPDEQQWQDESIPVPGSDEDAAHQPLADDQTQQSADAEEARWEVRAELPSHHLAAEVARRLRELLQAQGSPVFRRGKYLIVSAASLDEASVIAQAIRQQAQVNASGPFEASLFDRFEIHQPGTGGASYDRIDLSAPGPGWRDRLMRTEQRRKHQSPPDCRCRLRAVPV